MQLIEVHVIENVLNSEQNGQMIKKLTDAMVSIEGENTLSLRMPGRTASRASTWAAAWLPDPRIPKVRQFSLARCFAATAVVAPTRRAEMA